MRMPVCVATGAAVAAFLCLGGACGKDSETGPSPTVSLGSITASPPGTGLAGATSYTFTAAGFASSDGGPLTYAWEFGDGAKAAGGAKVAHTYADPGEWDVWVTATNGAGVSASARLSRLRTVSLTFNWYLRDAAGAGVMTWTTLAQSGSSVRGHQEWWNCRYEVTGSITLPRTLTLTYTRPPADCAWDPEKPLALTFTGTADGTFDVFTGTMTPGGAATLTRCRDLQRCP